MSLSEGKMFTIEALNRIEGFVWPEGAETAKMFAGFDAVFFYSSQKPYPMQRDDVQVMHPDWWYSVITREDFESVDGWVNNDNGKPNVGDVFVDVMFYSGNVSECQCVDELNWVNSDITKWRYHKPRKQEVKPDPESIETMIRRYKDAGENKRAAIDKLNQAQADVEQAEALEDSLFMAIEAWAESHGFDIRVLSESEEKPEMLITDWRDLQVGDVIWVGPSKVPCNEQGGECVIISEEIDRYSSGDRIFLQPFKVKRGDAEFDPDIGCRGWKFIRRPEKK